MAAQQPIEIIASAGAGQHRALGVVWMITSSRPSPPGCAGGEAAEVGVMTNAPFVVRCPRGPALRRGRVRLLGG
jgi:hypothetical protein